MVSTGDRQFELLRRATWTIFVLVLAAVGGLYAGNALNSERPRINHDVAYHSYLGHEMLQGSRLYVDLKEDNPPGNVLLLAGLIGLADRLGYRRIFATGLRAIDPRLGDYVVYRRAGLE